MNNRKTRNKIIICLLAAYAVIVVLLYAVEANAPGSSIHSIGEAIWYSIITLTTVGYGDIAPVTVAGRVLGVILALCSLGVLTALIGILVNAIREQAVPRMRLRSFRAGKWYVFNEENYETAALARSLAAEDPESVTIFLRSDDKHTAGTRALRISSKPEDLISMRGTADGIALFCMGEDHWNNYRQAAEASQLGVRSWCMSEHGSDDAIDRLHVFSRNEILSRSYWKNHPVTRDEKSIVIIGCGSAGTEILERALMTNVFIKGRYVTYHVFGSVESFERLHPVITGVLNGAREDDDRLCLYTEDWRSRPDIIRSADRIIVCEDDDAADLAVSDELARWFPTAAEVHVRLSADAGQVMSFGNSDAVFTAEFVVREELNRLAMTLNDIYNSSMDRPRDWSDLSDHLRRSNIAAADHMIVKVRCLLDDDEIRDLTAENCRRAYEVFCGAAPDERDRYLAMEHRRWMRFYQMYNWEYAPERNDAMRLHPMLLPFDEISREEQEKDAFAWEMLGKVATS